MKATDKTPKQIVAELDQYVVGQAKAKKAIAVALRNRYRRMQLDPAMQEEVTPKNVLMIGPTGVGKTEIARRLAKIVGAPFIKVEATKFTEVGYVGRDVESMVRDLVEVAYKQEEDRLYKEVRSQAAQRADKRLIKVLVPAKKKEQKEQQPNLMQMMRDLQSGKLPDYLTQAPEEQEEVTDAIRNERLSVSEQLKRGLLENTEVTIQVEEANQTFSPQNDMLGSMGIDLNETLGALRPKKMVKSTRLPLSQSKLVVKFHVKGFNATFYQSLKALKLRLSTGY